MQYARRTLWMIHLLAFVLLAVTWLAAAGIAPHAGSPLVALYYVLHIFPGSVIFVLILFEWLARNRAIAERMPSEPPAVRFNHRLHQVYYLILLALPVSGILVFFDPAGASGHALADLLGARPLYRLHANLFYALLVLVAINALVTLAHFAKHRFRR